MRGVNTYTVSAVLVVPTVVAAAMGGFHVGVAAAIATLIVRALWIIVAPSDDMTERDDTSRRHGFAATRLGALVGTVAATVAPLVARAATGNPVDDTNALLSSLTGGLTGLVLKAGAIGLAVGVVMWILHMKAGRAITFTVAGAVVAYFALTSGVSYASGFFH